jgi:IS30 family transposase
MADIDINDAFDEIDEEKADKVKPRKSKSGRPKGSKAVNKFIPTDQQRQLVIMMTANGVKHSEQARALNCGERTLQKHFKDELAFGKMRATAHVSGALYRNAMEGNVSAQIFWLKAQGGWREADRLEITGADGKNLLTDTEREQRLASILMNLSSKKPIEATVVQPKDKELATENKI